MKISVIIATRNRAGYLDRALESFAKQVDPPPFEVVVVDNGSNDPTAQVVERSRAHHHFETSYVYEERPNRGAARNRGIAVAQGELVLFCDDDVYAPPRFLRAHCEAHTAGGLVVNGPILNVPSYHERPRPSLRNFSRAFLCTCNVSVERSALQQACGFDEQFHLYGWEDTELGVRLRELGLRAKFAWDAYIWHIKPAADVTLQSELQKAGEKARMAARFVRKNPTRRVRAATGAYGVNLLRGRAMQPLLPWFAGLATDARMPALLQQAARAQLLDATYTAELARALTAGTK